MTVLRDYAAAVSAAMLPPVSEEPRAANPRTGPNRVPPLAPLSRYDEVIAPDGTLRPAWKAMASVALSLTPEELQRVDGEIARFLADDGVTYAPRGGPPQPWPLDPVPLVIDAPTWAQLDVGLAQRAELLNALLVDLYGPQTLLSSGILPAAAVFAHSGFMRPLARANGRDSQPLLLSGTDLGRDADGRWHVISDRVQAPSGLGFAMQNRRVISQVLPELFHEGDLHRMEPYFAALRAALLGAADGVDEPRVVVLTPGSHSETAFDQAFLANALGFPLVHGSDLVVRDGWVWTKPAGWPGATPTERIDVILRRVDAQWCDPLEMRADSRLGVAGLVEVARRGRVRLVNGLGAGVLENPALLPFLPAVCERLLGETLRLPGVPTRWCGRPEDLAEVLARIDGGDETLVVHPIDRPRAVIAALDPGELAARIAAEPYRYVGQDVLPLSQAPVWRSSGAVDARPVVLRTFTLRVGSAYRPLVGGLASVREDDETAPVTKDVWVLKAAETDADQGLAEIASRPLGRSVPAPSPRSLEDMFWAGRYAERAEDLLRLVLVTQAQFDQSGGHPSRLDEPTRVLIGALRRLAGARSVDPDAEFRALLLDEDRAGSAAHSIARLRDSLEGVRDQLSSDTWRVFSGIDRATKALRSSPHPHRTAESGGRMLTCVLSLHGVTASMMRDSGWRMIEAGRMLERALQVCRLLRSTMLDRRSHRADREVLETVLTTAESVVTYRRRYRGSVRIASVLELLLLDRDNPRSVAFALDSLRAQLAALPSSTGSTRPERLLDHLDGVRQETDVTRLAAGGDGQRDELERWLAEAIAHLEEASVAIARVHFEAGPPALPLTALALVEEPGTVVA